METMTRENWTDARLDDLSHRVDRGFEKVDRDIRDLRVEMKGGFDRIDARFDGMQRTLFLAAAGIVAALIGTQF